MNSNKKLTNSRTSLSPQLKKNTSKNFLSRSQLSLKDYSQILPFQSITKNREKLSNKLQTYSLLIRSKNPIRCLQHNSNISVYCQTQQKLLCANCIFGKNDHKFHKITTIQKCYDKMQRDIELMNRLIDKQIQNMNKTASKLMQNLMSEEKQTQDCLIGLVKIYEECSRRLEQSFVLSKNKILDRLSNIRSSHQKKMYEIKMLLSAYSSYNISKSLSREHIKDQEFLVYEHLVCSAITAQKRFQEADWLVVKGQVAKLTALQNKKIKLVAEQINTILSKQK